MEPSCTHLHPGFSEVCLSDAVVLNLVLVLTVRQSATPTCQTLSILPLLMVFPIFATTLLNEHSCAYLICAGELVFLGIMVFKLPL